MIVGGVSDVEEGQIDFFKFYFLPWLLGEGGGRVLGEKNLTELTSIGLEGHQGSVRYTMHIRN